MGQEPDVSAGSGRERRSTRCRCGHPICPYCRPGAGTAMLHGQLYPEIAEARIESVEDAIRVIDANVPLRRLVVRVAAAACEELNTALGHAHPPFDVAITRSMVRRVLADPSVHWHRWARWLGPPGAPRLKGFIDTWLQEPVDWEGLEVLCGDPYRIPVVARNLDARRAGGVCAPALTEAACQAREARIVAQLQQRFRPLLGAAPAGATAAGEPEPACDIERLAQALADSAWPRIVARLRQPVEVWHDDTGVRHVHVLGTGVYSVQPDGSLEVRVWEGFEDMAPVLDRALAGEISADPLPYGWNWFQRWRRGLRLEAQAVAGDAAPSVSNRAADLLQRRIRRTHDLRKVRRAIATALGLDPVALAVARRTRLLARGDFVSLSVYHRALQDIHAQRLLHRDAPALGLLYDTLGQAHDFGWREEPLKSLRLHLCMRHRLPQRIWRLVVKSRARLLAPVGLYYRTPDAAAVIDYLRLLDALGWHREPPRAFIETLLALRAPPDDLPTAGYTEGFARMMPALRVIVDRLERAGDAERDAMLGDMHTVLDWLDREGSAWLKGRHPFPAWRTLVRTARDWADEQLLAAQRGHERWPVPEPLSCGRGRSIVFIDAAPALRAEGRAMRHCVFDHVESCRAGVRRVASVRDRNGRRLATASWTLHDGAWSLDQIAGHANRPVGGELKQAIERTTRERMPAEPGPGSDLGPPAGIPWRRRPLDRLHPVPGMPAVPRGWGPDRPPGIETMRMPRSARRLCAVGWSWSPMHGRSTEYRLSLDRTRRFWLLWSRSFDHNWGRWQDAEAVCTAHRAGLQARVAAKLLLAHAWVIERDESQLDRFHGADCGGLLEPVDLDEIADATWGPADEDDR